MKKTLGAFIKVSKGLSQSDLGKFSGVSRGRICIIECDQIIPHFSTLKSICSALKVDFYEALMYIPKETNTDYIATLGSIIKNARISKGLSQQDLADLIGKTSTCISQIETNKVIPMRSTLILICSALKLDLNKLKSKGINTGIENLNVGSIIRDARIKTGLTQKELALLCKRKVLAIWRIENNITKVPKSSTRFYGSGSVPLPSE